MIRAAEKFINLMKENQGIDISIFEISFIQSILKSRMDDLAIKFVEDYFLYLEITKDENKSIVNNLYNSFSEFFRNPLTFSYIDQVVLPTLIHQKIKDNEREIRIWSAACSAGQEAYSVAMIYDEMTETIHANIDCHIFATDINPIELERAQKGVYQEAALNKVSLKRVNTYFTQEGEKYKILPRLGDYINFSVFDLLSENLNCPPASIYGNFDLVFCTNVLFYYNHKFRQNIIHKVSNCLTPGGYFITGETEREIVDEYKYREVFPHSGIFQKR